MDPNKSHDEFSNWSDVDDETDIQFMTAAYEYQLQMEQTAAQPPISRGHIFHKRELAEERLRSDYFDHNFFCSITRCYGSNEYKCSYEVYICHTPIGVRHTPDAFDEYLQMGASTSFDCLDNFTKCVIDLFMLKYLRKPTWSDIQNIYERHEAHHDFLRMLEAVASQDLWIWHAFFGMAGANNDINVLDNSPLFDGILNDVAPAAPYMVNGMRYEKGYYLADGIYPQWATFVKSFSATTDEKHGYFKKKTRKYTKGCRTCFWCSSKTLGYTTTTGTSNETCQDTQNHVLLHYLHNMILKDQKFALRGFFDMWVDPSARMWKDRWVDRCDVQRRRAKEIRNRETHTQLQRDLMEHLWQNHLQHQQQQEEYSEDDE